jgi:hypothetical protein
LGLKTLVFDAPQPTKTRSKPRWPFRQFSFPLDAYLAHMLLAVLLQQNSRSDNMSQRATDYFICLGLFAVMVLVAGAWS